MSAYEKFAVAKSWKERNRERQRERKQQKAASSYSSVFLNSHCSSLSPFQTSLIICWWNCIVACCRQICVFDTRGKNLKQDKSGAFIDNESNQVSQRQVNETPYKEMENITGTLIWYEKTYYSREDPGVEITIREQQNLLKKNDSLFGHLIDRRGWWLVKDFSSSSSYVFLDNNNNSFPCFWVKAALI